MTKRSATALMTAAIIAATGLVACGSGDNEAGTNQPPVSIGLTEPGNLVPSNLTDSSGGQIVAALWTPLVRFDNSGRLLMAAADSITSTDDQKVWTIKLKSGWAFHNGEPVTADNYLAAWNYTAYGPNAQLAASAFERIVGYADLQSSGSGKPKSATLSGLKKVDDQTIQVMLSQPFVDFDKALGQSAFDPLPKAAFNADGTLNKKFGEAPIGQGPFQMDGVWNHNRNIAVKAYGAYQGTKPRVNAIDFKMYEDPNTMYNDVVAGNLDVQPHTPPSKLSQAPKDFGDRYKKTPSSYVGYIAVPNYIPAYTHDVRVAISKSIDRQEIVQKIFQGTAGPANSWVSSTVQGYRPDTCGNACVYDPAAAKALWDKAGGVPGNKISLYYNADGGHKEWVDAVCNQLKTNLGVNCVGAPVAQFADLVKQLQQKTLQGLVRGAWLSDYPSMVNYLAPQFLTNAPFNASAYSNKTFDQTITNADAEATDEEAIKGYQHAEDILAKDLPVLPTWFRDNAYVYSTRMAVVNEDITGSVDVITLETT